MISQCSDPPTSDSAIDPDGHASAISRRPEEGFYLKDAPAVLRVFAGAKAETPNLIGGRWTKLGCWHPSANWTIVKRIPAQGIDAGSRDDARVCKYSPELVADEDDRPARSAHLKYQSALALADAWAPVERRVATSA
jgi:hypothetical protein